MTLKQLQNLVKIDEDVTNPENGTYYDKRTIEQLLEYGLVLIDKPPGPTSHEVVAWAKRILEIPKAGHSGTLDPQVSGVLPLGLGEGTKALGVLLLGPKEYHALGRLHSLPSKEKLEKNSLFLSISKNLKKTKNRRLRFPGVTELGLDRAVLRIPKREHGSLDRAR